MSDEATKPAVSRGALLTVGLFAIAIGALWVFPAFWYRASALDTRFVWLAEQTNVPGWLFKEVPIAKAAEAILVGDRTVTGEFLSGDATGVIRGFSIKRYLPKQNEVGLFIHTPDRCWTRVGWKIQLIEPESVECQIHGLTMRFERRLFIHGEVKELVYFGAIVGGKALPYRLDQHLASNLKKAERGDLKSALLGVISRRSWGWTWDAFVHRTALRGPQQFIRISTPVTGPHERAEGISRAKPGEIAEADERLRRFLPQWLVPVDYGKEYEEWRKAR